MFKKVATLSLFSAFSLWLNGADFEVTKGWNLLGTTEKISDLSSFKYQGINIIWVFDKINKKWKVYAPEYNGTLTFDTIDEIPAKSGFWVYSKNDNNISTNLCNLDLKSLGYQIKYTYCSYSSGDIGRFWGESEGFFDVPSSEKNQKASELESTFVHCGIYQKDKIEELGGESPCYEAHVYWDK